jgi:hypothetical protein
MLLPGHKFVAGPMDRVQLGARQRTLHYLLWPVMSSAWHVISAVDDLQLAVTSKRQPAKAQHIQQHTQGLQAGAESAADGGNFLESKWELFSTWQVRCARICFILPLLLIIEPCHCSSRPMTFLLFNMPSANIGVCAGLSCSAVAGL